MPEDIASYLEDGQDLRDIPRIGEALAGKIREYLTTGRLGYLEDLKESIPPAVREFVRVPGLGAKRARLIHDSLGIESVEELKTAAETGQLRELPGLGEKSEASILQGIIRLEKGFERMLLDEATAIAEPLVARLSSLPQVDAASYAGSLRRMKETIGDIDIVVASEEPDLVITAFKELPDVSSVVACGDTKCSVVNDENRQIDLRVVEPSRFGAALQYFTGSKMHNIKVRAIASGRGMKLNEYGLFREEDGVLLAGADEAGIYAALGMDLMEPTLREDGGEVEAAQAHTLPGIVRLQDIKGDLHCHSEESDGRSSLVELKNAAAALGYEYLNVSDHAKGLPVARGLDEERFLALWSRIDELNEEPGLRLLKGVELNIGNDGSLDFSEDFLAGFDVVIASIHGGFNQEAKQLDERLLAAVEHPSVNIIAHPSGRLLGRRAPYSFDIEALIAAASRTGTCLELNSYPDRLDLKDEHLRMAVRAGVRITLGTDSHAASQLANMRYGVGTAQRGWCERKDVLNCLGLEDLLSLLRH